MKNQYKVIEKILLTEKSLALSSLEGQKKYAFRVSTSANKLEIKDAVERLFGVKVAQVNTMNRQGKDKRVRTANYGRTPAWKRAVVTLVAGNEIPLN